jgi:hypothetical protein
MNVLSDDERNQLRYYAGTERILHGTSARGPVHQHLLRSCYIEERTVDARDALIVMTAAGRKDGAIGLRRR